MPPGGMGEAHRAAFPCWWNSAPRVLLFSLPLTPLSGDEEEAWERGSRGPLGGG